MLPESDCSLKGIAYLPAHLSRGETKTPPAFADSKGELRLARGEAIVDILDLGKLSQFCREKGAGLIEDLDIPVAQFYGDCRAAARTAAIRLKGGGFNPDDRPGLLTPKPGNLTGS